MRWALTQRLSSDSSEAIAFLFGNWTMFDTLGNHEHFARPKCDDPVAQLDIHAAGENQKEVIRIVVLMPNKLALNLDHHQVVAVELADHTRLPVFFERRQFRREIYRLHRHFSARPRQLLVYLLRRRLTFY